MTSACGSLQDANIGSVTGSATYDACDSDTISISANNVPSSTADKQYSVQREVCGDGEVIVKVLSVSGGLAGLELRASNAAGAIKVGLRTALGTSVQRFVRTSTDGSQSSNTFVALGHQWLKLVRSGSSVSTYTSTNGSTWNFAATYTVSLPTCVQASLLMQSVNVGTTHTGVFKDLQFSSFTAPAGDTTTVSFDQDTISANAGDTVMICVNIANPCDCSPTEVDVELQGSGSPHLSGYSTQTLVFDDTTGQECFPLVISGAAGSANYTLSLDNVSGGNGAETETPASLTIAVTGIDDGSPLYCGVGPIMSNSAFPNETPIAFDRFGNEYVYSQLITQAGGGSSSSFGPSENLGFGDCDCSDVGIDLELFDLWFEDCSFNTSSGFAAAGQTGEDRRRAMCAVFQYLESIITPNPSICNPNDPRRVNVRIQPSVPLLNYFGDPLPGFTNPKILGYASPYFPRMYFNPGIAHTIPQIIINSGEYPQFASENTMHGMIRMNFDFNWNLDYDTPTEPSPPPLTPVHDFFSASLHEALHMLGFVSSFTIPDGLRGSTNSNNSGLYFSFDQFLLLDRNGGESLILNDSPTDDFPLSPSWRFNSAINPATDMHQSCLGGSTGPDMEFTGIGGSYPIFTDASFQTGSSFSHLEGACDLTQIDPLTIPYVMNPSLPRSTDRRTLHAHELDIMSRIGYPIGEDDCAVGAAPDGNNHSCGDFEYVLQICPPSPGTISIRLADLLENDPNATEVAYISPIFASGTGALNAAGTHYDFTVSQLGSAQLVYAVRGCNGELGNASIITINVTLTDNPTCVNHCPDIPFCEDYPNVTDCTEFHTNECEETNNCNLICNSELCGAWLRNIFVYDNPPSWPPNTFIRGFNIGNRNHVAIPGWVIVQGVPRYENLPDQNEVIFHDGNSIHFSVPNSVMTYASIASETEYLFAFTRDHGQIYFANLTGTLSLDIVRGQDILLGGSGPFTTAPPFFAQNNGPVLNIYTRDIDNNTPKDGGHFSVDQEDWLDYSAFQFTWNGWNQSTNNPSFTQGSLSNFEVIADNFTAGPDLSTAFCNEPVQMGGEFCMLSDVGVLYEWLRVEPDGQGGETLTPVASYEVLNGQVSNISGNIDPVTLQLTVAPAQTTTYRLRRSIYEYGGLPTTFDFCNTEPDGTVTTDCNKEDDLTVFVSVPLPDAHFTFSETDCVFDFTSSDDTPGLEHEWTFGNTGQISMAMNPGGIVLPNGMHTIIHEVTGICGVDTYSEIITVEGCCELSFPSAEYVFEKINTCGLYRFWITEYSEGVTEMDIDWDFGATEDIGEEVEATFTEPGEHTFTLTLTNSCGLITTYEETIEVVIDLPDASFTPTIFCLNTFFEAAQTEGDHFWDFGDGETDDTNNPTPQHTFEAAGTYTVEHTFTNTCGFEDIEDLMITVTECDEENFTCPCEAGYNIEAPENGEVLLSDLINTGTLPEVSLVSTCLALKGRLIIDEGYAFVNIEGRMHSGSEIVVEPAATLTLSGVTQNGGLHGCEEMWRGIRVFGSGGGLLRSKGSLISDAQYAVHALDKSTIDIQGTTFTRNYIGLFYDNATPGAFDLWPFTSNTFDGEEDLLLPYDGQMPEVGNRPFAGISITNCGAPISIGVTGSGTSGVNTFRDIHNGILALNTPLSVKSSVFENVVEVTNEPEYAFTGFGIRHQGGAAHPLTVIGLGDELTDDASFSNCTNAVWGRGTNASITENNMENVVTGVRLEFCTLRTLTVADNRINAVLAGVDLFQNAPAASISVISNKINMNEGNGALGAGTAIRVEENTLPHPASSAVIDDNRIIAYGWYDQGIRLSSASTWNVTNNSIKLEGVLPSAIGINVLKGSDNWVRENQVEGESSGFGINVNASGNIFLECNTVTANYAGLNLVGDNSGADVATTLFRIPMVIGLRYTNGILAPIQNGRGNRWEGTEEDYVEVAAVHEGSTEQGIQETAYRVFEHYDPMEEFNFYPPSIDFPSPLLGPLDPEEWFPLTGSAAITCEEQPQFTDGEEQLNLAHRIAKDSVNNFPAGTVWDAKWGLYERLLKTPALMSEDTILSDFFDETELTTLGELVEIEQAKAALFGSTTETEAIALFAQDLDSLIQLIQEVDSLIVADSLTVIPSEREEWLEAAQFLVDTLQDLAFIVDSLRLLEIEALIEDNDEITATTRPEKNQRTINKLYLDMLAKGSLTFTQSEKDTLAAIAMQCPQIGGRAVFVARAMRAYYSDATYVETEPCVDSISMLAAPQAGRILPQDVLKPQQEEEATVKIFPNPAGDYVTVMHSFEQATQLFLYDAYGSVRKTGVLSGAGQQHRISITSLAPGVYIASIVAENAKAVNLRLIIVR